ncbi:hypothetical protein DFJ74DRAFT_695321 [Hyaloraphidium curvatum]|nr:hypothetical protein DFJ74DRAFT_695321 [Hyaloraphidium curvatum]
MFHDVVGSREYDFWDSWLRAPAGNFGLERRRAWDAAAALAATFTAVPAEIRVPVAVAQLAAKKCQFCCASPGIPVAPWGWRCCKGTHAVWELPWGLGKKHMAGFPAGKTKAFSKVHKHRIEFEVYSKFTVEQAARRLWEVPEGASLGERYKEGACRRKALIRTKLEERKLLHFTQRVSKIAFAKMRELELGAPWSEVERCVDEAVDECERHIREKRAARQGAPAAA